MAHLIEELESFIMVGNEELRFVFREPTPKEENEFEGKKVSAKRNKVQDKSFPARVSLFDLLFERVENLTNPKAGLTVGPDKKQLTKETVNLLPNRYKADLILFAYEATGASKDSDDDDDDGDKKKEKKPKN